MRTFMGLISSDDEICQLYKKEKESLIPRDIRNHGKISALSPVFFIGVFDPRSQDEIEEYLLHATRSADAAFLLVERKHEHMVSQVRDAYFTATFDPPDAQNRRNYLGATFARLVKNFAFLIERMHNAEEHQALILPLRNFDAPELRQLRELCTAECMANDFARRLVPLTSSLKLRRRPRRQSTSQRKHFVDDRSKLFEYGFERHSRLPTGEPHNARCELTGTFRFGKRIDAERHFNVTKEAGAETKISGIFSNCHDEEVEVRETTHLNMFSNDSF